MNDAEIKETVQTAKTCLESFKRIFALLRRREWFAALKEIFSFFRLVYVDHLKGKYVTVKGKRIPRTLIAVLALFAAWIALPSGNTADTSDKEAAEVKKDSNTYDSDVDGIRVYDMRKCETENKSAACGTLENYGSFDYDKVIVAVNFHAGEGTVIYEGMVEADQVKNHTRMKMAIPCPDDFAYFKLKDVRIEGKKEVE